MKKSIAFLILMLMVNTAYAAGPGLSPTTGISAGLDLSRAKGVLGPANGGTGSSTALTQGSVVYAGAGGAFSQNNANFFWDNSNVRLGIGTSSPSTSLMVSGATGNNTLTLGPYTGSGSGIIIINNNNSGTLGTGTISGTQTNGMEFNDAQGFNFSTTGLTNPSAHATVQITGNFAVGSGYVGTTPPTNGAIIQSVVGIGTTVPISTSNYLLDIRGGTQLNAVVSNGTKFTTSGCSVSATTGGATAGTYTSGTTGSCVVVITMNGATGLTAPTGWSCFASDRTTPADLITQTASATTTATLSGVTASGDVISFGCMGY